MRLLIKNFRDYLFQFLDDLLALAGLLRGCEQRLGVDRADVLKGWIEGMGSLGHANRRPRFAGCYELIVGKLLEGILDQLLMVSRSDFAADNVAGQANRGVHALLGNFAKCLILGRGDIGHCLFSLSLR